MAAVALLCVATAVGAQAPGPRCAGSEHRAFDFWLGTWDVYLPDGTRAGENTIESIAGGCALLERWTDTRGGSGKSLNVYDRKDARWHQSWVDANGGRLELVGTSGPNTMTLASPDQRITWTANADGTVRQLWESRDDKSGTWTLQFDGKYVRRK